MATIDVFTTMLRTVEDDGPDTISLLLFCTVDEAKEDIREAIRLVYSEMEVGPKGPGEFAFDLAANLAEVDALEPEREIRLDETGTVRVSYEVHALIKPAVAPISEVV